MARSRNIKPSIMSNEELAELSTEHRLLFIYLWMLADREGRLEDRPKRIGAQAFPYEKIDAEQILADLERSGFIERYEACDLKVIHITNFLKHQSPHGTERDSALPDKSGTYKRHKRGRNGYATGEAQLVSCDGEVKELSSNGDLTVKTQLDNSTPTVRQHPDSPNHDSLIPDSNNQPLPFQGAVGLMRQAAQAAGKGDASEFHANFVQTLRDFGWSVETEHCVEDRGDGRGGRIDVLVTRPLVIGVELDRSSVREKSVFKLQQIDGFRVAVLRDAQDAGEVKGLDAVICAGASPDDLPEPHELPKPTGVLGNSHPDAGLAHAAIKATGVGAINSSHPKLNALLHAGVTIEQIADACRRALAKNKTVGYALAIAEREAEEARATAQKLSAPVQPQKPSRYSPEAYADQPAVGRL